MSVGETPPVSSKKKSIVSQQHKVKVEGNQGSLIPKREESFPDLALSLFGPF
jgi:hypothetical protein